METAEQNQDEVLATAPPALPKVGFGYLIAAALLTLEIVMALVDPASNELFLLFYLVFVGGFFFYLFCVYRIHTVIAHATFFSYPISPLKAVGFHFIPLYNLYWVLVWPNKIAEVVNQKLASEEMRYWVSGLLLLVGIIFVKIDSGIGLALLFGGLHYITRKVKPVISGQVVKKKHGFLKYVAIGAFTLVVLAVGALIIIPIGPYEVIPGKQLEAKYANTIKELNLLDTDEEILYWSTDAIFDFMEGFYFFTNKKVVVYSSKFDNPAILVPYSDIIDIDFKHNPSSFDQSRITLFLNDGTQVFFPVSNMNGGDKKFYDLLLATWQKTLSIEAKSYRQYVKFVTGS